MRGTRKPVAAVFEAVLIAALFVLANPAPANAADSGAEAQFVAKINSIRQSKGLAPGRQTFGQISHRGCTRKGIQHRLQSHARRLQTLARPTSAMPATRASQSNGPRRSPREAEENASPAAS